MITVKEESIKRLLEVIPDSKGKLILEVECIVGSCKIIITRDGNIGISPIGEKKEIDIKEIPLSTEFWVNLANLINSLYVHNEQLSKHTQTLADEIIILDQTIEKERENKKVVKVSSNKKGMFVAGIAFARNNNKCT